MRALEQRTRFTGNGDDIERNMCFHHENIRNAKLGIDTSPPRTTAKLHRRERERERERLPVVGSKPQARIDQENQLLAQRLHHIMEQPGDLLKQLCDLSHIQYHPVSMNYKLRAAEADNIHRANASFAGRLDSVKSAYSRKATTPNSIHYRNNKYIGRRRSGSRRRPSSSMVAAPLLYGLSKASRQSHDHSSSDHNSNDNDDGSVHHRTSWMQPSRSKNDDNSHSSIRAKWQHDASNLHDLSAELGDGHIRIVFECSKIENGRILDCAIVKNNLEQRFYFFGLDVENGSKHELVMTVSEVLVVLKDSLVPVAVRDHRAKWMMLINKVHLRPVQEYSNAYFDMVEQCFDNNVDNEPRTSVSAPSSIPASTAMMVPRPPSSSSFSCGGSSSNGGSSIRRPVSRGRRQFVPAAAAGHQMFILSETSSTFKSNGSDFESSYEDRSEVAINKTLEDGDHSSNSSSSIGHGAPIYGAVREEEQQEQEDDDANRSRQSAHDEENRDLSTLPIDDPLPARFADSDDNECSGGIAVVAVEDDEAIAVNVVFTTDNLHDSDSVYSELYEQEEGGNAEGDGNYDEPFELPREVFEESLFAALNHLAVS